MSITIERLPLPPGSLPVDALRSTLRAYRRGEASADQLIRTVDRRGQVLEERLTAKLAHDLAEYHRTLRRLELLASWIETRRQQIAWIHAFPNRGRDPGPLRCRLPSGHVAAVPILTGPLHELELDPRLIANGNGAEDRRRGAGPAMVMLDRAGLSCADVAAALDVGKPTAWRWLTGTTAYPAELAPALEQLTDAKVAREILELIPCRNGP
jgi:hypothetical protein